MLYRVNLTMNEVRNHNIGGGHSCSEANTNNVNKTNHALI